MCIHTTNVLLVHGVRLYTCGNPDSGMTVHCPAFHDCGSERLLDPELQQMLMQSVLLAGAIPLWPSRGISADHSATRSLGVWQAVLHMCECACCRLMLQTRLCLHTPVLAL